ncbi:glucose 1-dehydrogenase [Bacillus sp. FJAT-42376]|uniref:SDR family NAD(P)-dependent oxidoreductase n=1 Tax=Bacillus sp. FJAT-42376 TaxID=2014076 RepID=UPI000F4F2221|nr:glucose 1-dehydrogenase [Bacillus sp. FJAT-42376]AZB43188.1 glucose 1-dehydrogenase [Bacillus sp. FJAT-42376]
MEAKTVIVTGASNGIGEGIARAYSKEGFNVVLADYDSEKGKKLETELLEQNDHVLFIKTDVRNPEDILGCIKETIRTFGGIDVLINNAGAVAFKDPFELTVEEWDNILSTNLRSVFLFSREAARHMKDHTGGSIVNIASTRSQMSEPDSEAYAASKGGIVALTHALAASFADYSITVNAISPGWIHTGNLDDLREVDHTQHLSGRVGEPSDIAGACLYLTHSSNSFVNGANLVIDGGMTRKMIYEH